MPECDVDYLEYKCDAKIKNQVYVNLVQQGEKSHVQQDMDSMDVQVVGPAILSFEEKRVWSQSKWVTAIGLVLGWLISFVYRLFIYKNTAR